MKEQTKYLLRNWLPDNVVKTWGGWINIFGYNPSAFADWLELELELVKHTVEEQNNISSAIKWHDMNIPLTDCNYYRLYLKKNDFIDFSFE